MSKPFNFTSEEFGDAERAALEWLEQLSPPSLAGLAVCRMRAFYEAYPLSPAHHEIWPRAVAKIDLVSWPPAVDQPTLGLILCRDKNRLIAEYALRDIHKPIGVAGWETKLVESLPKNLCGSLSTIEELEAALSREPAPVKPPKRWRRGDD